MKKVMPFTSGSVFGILATLIIGWFALPHYQTNSKPWFDISAEVKKKINTSIVRVTAGQNAGSGCEIEADSEIYLTSLHIIAAALLDEDEIYINNRSAKLITKSRTNDDFAVLTTLPSIPKNISFESLDYLPPGQNIIIAGHPASLEYFIQPGKTMDAAKDASKNSIPGLQNFSAQLTEVGISGGCVYLEDGTGPVGVAIKRNNDGTYTTGIMTLVRKKTK